MIEVDKTVADIWEDFWLLPNVTNRESTREAVRRELREFLELLDEAGYSITKRVDPG